VTGLTNRVVFSEADIIHGVFLGPKLIEPAHLPCFFGGHFG